MYNIDLKGPTGSNKHPLHTRTHSARTPVPRTHASTQSMHARVHCTQSTHARSHAHTHVFVLLLLSLLSLKITLYGRASSTAGPLLWQDANLVVSTAASLHEASSEDLFTWGLRSKWKIVSQQLFESNFTRSRIKQACQTCIICKQRGRVGAGTSVPHGMLTIVRYFLLLLR